MWIVTDSTILGTDIEFQAFLSSGYCWRATWSMGEIYERNGLEGGSGCNSLLPPNPTSSP